MIVSHIVAATSNRVIGKENDLPWHLPDDMRFFKETTRDHHVLLGRKNYDSLPEKWKPLPQRTNIVITRRTDLELPGAIVVNSIEAGLEIARKNGETEAFIIGGGEIYAQSMDLVDRIYYTDIHTELKGDTHYPEIDLSEWKEISSHPHPADEKHKYSFTFKVYERRS